MYDSQLRLVALVLGVEKGTPVFRVDQDPGGKQCLEDKQRRLEEDRQLHLEEDMHRLEKDRRHLEDRLRLEDRQQPGDIFHPGDILHPGDRHLPAGSPAVVDTVGSPPFHTVGVPISLKNNNHGVNIQ